MRGSIAGAVDNSIQISNAFWWMGLGKDSAQAETLSNLHVQGYGCVFTAGENDIFMFPSQYGKNVVFIGGSGVQPEDTYTIWGTPRPCGIVRSLASSYISSFVTGREAKGGGFLSDYRSGELTEMDKKGYYHSKEYYSAGEGAHLINAELNAGVEGMAVLRAGGAMLSGSYLGTIAFGKAVVPEFIRRRLEQLRTLGDKWDSYDAKIITDEAIRTAENALVEVMSSYKAEIMEEVFISPCSDGGLQLEWGSGGDKELDLRILPTGKMDSYFLVGCSDNGSTVKMEQPLRDLGEWRLIFNKFNKLKGIR